jgi:hypothetical protein
MDDRPESIRSGSLYPRHPVEQISFHRSRYQRFHFLGRQTQGLGLNFHTRPRELRQGIHNQYIVNLRETNNNQQYSDRSHNEPKLQA